MEYVGRRYDDNYARIKAAAGDSPLDRLKAAVDFNLNDVSTAATRHFFIQFWPLLGVADNYSGELLEAIYKPQKRQIAELISSVNPALSETGVRQRTEVITALLEGLIVTTHSEEVDWRALKSLITEQAIALALAGKP